MNRKTIIQIAVITVCFGAAGLVLYNGLFKGSGSSAPETSVVVGVSGEASNPLPFGDDLSGQLKKVLGKNSLQYDLFDYPKLNEAEVGIPASDLVKPLPVKQ